MARLEVDAIGPKAGRQNLVIAVIETPAGSRKKIIKNAKLKVYKGAPHGMCTTLKEMVNEELITFIKG